MHLSQLVFFLNMQTEDQYMHVHSHTHRHIHTLINSQV